MKKRWISLVGVLFLAIGLINAQYCPPTRSNIGTWRAASINDTRLYFALENFSFDFSNAINDGVRQGTLTQHEVFVLESKYDRLARRVRRAFLDGRVTRTEWSMIEFAIRNLNRDLRREWNDDQVRLG